MKKVFGFFALLLTLTSCGGFIKNENGSEHLVQLTSEPVNCTFLYKKFKYIWK